MFIKKLSKNHIILRLLLLFAWFPIGVFILPKSSIIKHKFWFGLIYLSLWVLIGFPVLIIFSGIIEIMVGTMHSDEVFVLFENFMQSSFQIFKVFFLILFVSVPVYTVLFIKDKKKLKKNELSLYKTSVNEVKQDDEPKSSDSKQSVNISHPIASESFNVNFNHLITQDTELKSTVSKQNAYISQPIDSNVKVGFEELKVGVNHGGKSLNSSQTFEKSLISKSNSYKKAELLTPREKGFYKELLTVSEKLNYTVSTKIRFADLVNVNDNVKKHSPEWQSNFNKIAKKHIDFALIQKDDLSVKMLIELDDSSHYAIDRQQRDAFVDSVCNQAGIPILHVWNSIDLEEKILNTLKTKQI